MSTAMSRRVFLPRSRARIFASRSVLPDLRCIPCRWNTQSALSTNSINEKTSSPSKASSKSVKPFHEIPEPRWSLPYFGVALHYHLHLLPPVALMRNTLAQWRRELGPIIKVRHHGTTSVHLFNPDDYETVYKAEGKSPAINPLLSTVKEYREMRGFSLGVGNTNGEDWYRVRSAVNQLMMRPQAVYDFLDLEVEVADDFIRAISNHRHSQTKQLTDLRQWISRWNFETAGYIVFGRRFHWLEETSAIHEVNRMINTNNEMFLMSTRFNFSVIPWHKWWTTPLWRIFVHHEDYFYGNVVKYFQEAVARLKSQMAALSPEDNVEKRDLFLSFLLKLEYLSMKDIHTVAQSLFTDGLSTTVATLQGILYCLAANPEKQERLRQEVKEKVGLEGAVTIAALKNMPYLKACVKEAFRFFPIGPDVSRINKEDLVLSGYHIPAGSNLYLDNSVLLQDKEYFCDPEKYLPERWLRDNEMAKRDSHHPFVLLPFSHGPRMCLGRRFAEQEMFLLLVKLVQKFQLKWQGEQPMRQRYQTLFVPDCEPEIAFEDLPSTSEQ